MTVGPSNPLANPAHLRSRLAVVLIGVVAAVMFALSFFTISAFDRAIAPEIEARTRLIGEVVRAELQRALELGIPITDIRGLEAYLGEMIADFPEMRRITILAATGQQVAEVRRDDGPSMSTTLIERDPGTTEPGPYRYPVLVGTRIVGEIAVEGDPHFARSRLRDAFLDVSVLAVAILLIGVEIALLALAASIWKPYRRIMVVLDEQRRGTFRTTIRERGPRGLRRLATRLNDHVDDLWSRSRASGSVVRAAPLRLRLSDIGDVRLPLFLLALSTEVTASFLPVFAADASRPAWLSAEAAAAAPLMAYLLGAAILSPLAASLTRLLGTRRLVLAAILPIVAALVGMALTDSVVGITVARVVIAVAYAVATVACQEYALHLEGPDHVGRASGIYFSTVFAGAFCGTVIGGVIAGRFGYAAAIFAGAGFALATRFVGYATLGGRAGNPRRGTSTASGPITGADRLRLGALFGGVALPAAATTATFIWYLIPVLLTAEGLPPGDIARVVMTYYLSAVLIGPVVTSLTGRPQSALTSVVFGGLISGLSLLSLSFWMGFWALAMAVAGVGVGHTMIRAPLYQLAIRWSGATKTPLNLLRGLERAGAIFGLVIAASLVGAGAAASLTLGLSIIVGCGAILLVIVGDGETRSQGGAS